MARLAQARADEVGAAVLWCDGGSGGVSGVYGAGRGVGGLDVAQTGNGGTWLATVGVPFEDDDGDGERTSRTMYGTLGDFGSFLTLMAIVAFGLGYEMGLTWWSGRRSVTAASGQADDDDDVATSKWTARVTGRLGGGVRQAIGYITRRGAGVSDQQALPPVSALQEANLIDVEG